MSNKSKNYTENEWLDKALESYEKRNRIIPIIFFQQRNDKPLSADIKEQMKLDKEQCELLLNANFEE